MPKQPTKASSGDEAAGPKRVEVPAQRRRERISQAQNDDMALKVLMEFVKDRKDFVAAALVDEDFCAAALANREIVETTLRLLGLLMRTPVLALSRGGDERKALSRSDSAGRVEESRGAVTYDGHVFPMFRPIDILCMLRHPSPTQPVKLASYEWLSQEENFERVHAAVAEGWMPPDGQWSAAMIATLVKWKDDGFRR